MTSPAIPQDVLREKVLAAIERIWNANDWSTAPDTYAEDVVVHVPFQEEPLRGREEFRGFHEALHTAFPDWHATVEAAVTEGDTVAMRWTIRGTSTGPFMGFPPTGKSYVTTEAVFARIANGKGAEFWFFINEAEIARQLGLMPSGPPPKALLFALRMRQRLRRKR